MKTLQQALDRVIRHLATQNRKAVNNGLCVYRAPNGLMCAIGSLIDDEFYSPHLESKGPRSPSVKNALKKSGWRTDNFAIDFYCELQRVHDKSPRVRQLGFVGNDNVILQLKDIARRYDRTFNPGPLSSIQESEAA